MISEEKQKIKDFAAGQKELRSECVEIFRKYLRPYTGFTLGPQETPEMAFMSEIDNICPCYIMKRIYREKLLEKDVDSSV